MRFSRGRRIIGSAALSIATVGAALTVGAAPAMALKADCNRTGPNWCQTANLPSSNGHQIKMVAYWRQTTCRVYDRHNGIQVGYVHVPNGSIQKVLVINGLYGEYFATCYNANGGPDGDLVNAW
jgi:hypothetical protein